MAHKGIFLESRIVQQTGPNPSDIFRGRWPFSFDLPDIAWSQHDSRQVKSKALLSRIDTMHEALRSVGAPKIKNTKQTKTRERFRLRLLDLPSFRIGNANYNVYLVFGRFPAELGPETRSNGSGSKNGAERTHN